MFGRPGPGGRRVVPPPRAQHVKGAHFEIQSNGVGDGSRPYSVRMKSLKLAKKMKMEVEESNYFPFYNFTIKKTKIPLQTLQNCI